MTATASTLGPSAYWYVTRSTGAVALLLLTLSVVLGVLASARFSAPRWPRFAVDALHRDVSLLVVVMVAVHVITTVADGFAPISLIDGVIPFHSPYRPLWLSLGTIAFDLLLALAVSSLLRRRLGYRLWRAIHWLAYASWPVAVLHGLGTGTDVKSAWLLVLSVLCVAAVVVAVLIRLARTPSAVPGIRTTGTALAIATPIGLGAFALLGPLQKGWARRAGTPLPHAAVSRVALRQTVTPASTRTSLLTRPFTATLFGTVSQVSVGGGAIVTLDLRLGGGVSGHMRIRLGGAPLPEGGLSLTGSQVDLTGPGLPSALGGKVTSLQGSTIIATVRDTTGTVVNLRAGLSIDQSNGNVTGTLTGTPVGGGG